jgi:DNA-binding transcriptional LysR family regulator
MMPHFFAKPEVMNGTLVPLLADWEPDRRRVFCAFQRQRYMGKKLRAFIDLVGKSVENIDSFNTWVVTPYPERA